MSIFRDMRASRSLKFLLVHAIVSVAVCAVVISKHAHVPPPTFVPYFIVFTGTFLGSLASSLLSLVHLITGLLKGFSGATELVLYSHPIPLPVVAGVSSILAILFLIIGIRSYKEKIMYLVFLISSFLFIFCSYAFFIDSASNAKAMLGFPVLMQQEK